MAEADCLPVGGAHAIAALAYGAGDVLEPCDAVVGPGNAYVTAAKSIIAGRVAIDMLAGPSEVLVIADDQADAHIVAADLLAQAEHDPSARSYLVCTSASFADAVDKELEKQLAALSTKEIAGAALKNGCCVVVSSLDEAVEISDRLAPEHLELCVEDPMELKLKLKHYGGLFCGQGAAEVLGDYGAGPTTLPTGGTARSTGGLCTLTFRACARGCASTTSPRRTQWCRTRRCWATSRGSPAMPPPRGCASKRARRVVASASAERHRVESFMIMCLISMFD